MTKVIAMYLPQFHQIPENDEFWGKGFTDWVTVRNAKPLFEGHLQPRVPQNDNYYDLSVKENVEWQAKLAFDHGIYGYGVYHYWFNNEKNLLTKPAEIMRDDDSIKTKYFFVWDNGNWKRSWSNVDGNDWAPITDASIKEQTGPQILIPYILGKEEDWENHYNYLRSHFLSERYEKRQNKPVFSIIYYNMEIKKMCEYWDALAKKDGFDGMCFIIKNAGLKKYPKGALVYNYEPHHTNWDSVTLLARIKSKLLRTLNLNFQKDITTYDYDRTWKKLLKYAKNHKNPSIVYGAFVDYDDTPRRGTNKSRLIVGASPDKFEKYFKQLISIARKQNKDYIFLTAWNEWGEGAYLEPDSKNGMRWLESIKRSVL